jgi:predicted dehydrogenase
MSKLTRTLLIGTGGFARYHLQSLLKQTDTTVIPFACEPDPSQFAKAEAVFREAGINPPANQPDLTALLKDHGQELDAALIVTPHVFHHDQTQACLEAGLDVLLEKPMVMNAGEARSLMETRDRTGKTLVVAFPGSLSPQVRMAVSMLRSGALGPILNIAGTVWQSWGPGTVGTWRQNLVISGGGFLFDTGAHLLNTIADLAGEDFAEIAAWMDNSGRPVDTRAVVIGRLKSGALVTLNGCGEAIPSCASDVRVFTTQAILYTGVWGEKLQIQYRGDQPVADIPVPPSMGVWEQFLAVRNQKIANPCPPEVGLRMARLWDAIRASSERKGAPVNCEMF